MIRRWTLVLMAATTICFLSVAGSPQSADQTVLNRENDDAAQTRSERERAATMLVEAAVRLRSTDPVKAAHFLNRAGSLHLRLNSSEEALRNYQSALDILKRNRDPATNVETLNGLAAVYNQLSKCSESTKLIGDALALSEQHSLIAGKAEALLRLSDCQNLKDHPAAAQTAEQSLQLWESLGDKRGIALAYDTLIDVALTQNDINQATQRGESSLQLWRELGITDRQAGALISLGFIEYRKGAWQNCISLLVEAQSLIDENDEPYLLGKINAGIAEAFIESGLPESGLLRARESLNFFTKSEDARGMAAATWDIGKAFFLLGNYPEAFKAFDSALRQSETNDDLLIEALCHDFIARTHVAVGNADSALIEFKTSLDQYERIGNVRGAARVQTLMGSIYERQGRVNLARNRFETALARFEKIQDRVDESATAYALGSLELRQSRLDIAENFLRRSLLEIEDINRASTSSDLAAALAPTVYGRYQTYIECLMKRSRDQNQGQDAFQASESAHGRSLAEMLKATETSLLTSLNPELAAKEKSLRQQLRVKEDSKIRLLAADYRKEDLDRLEQDVAQLSQEYNQVRESIKTAFPAFDQLTKPVAWPLKRIQQEVVADDQTLLLEYSLGSESSYAWIVTREGFSSYQLPGEKQIEQIAQRLYNLLTSRQTNQSELDQATAILAQTVLFPFAERLDKHRIILVADGALNYIPFQILPTAPSNKQPLIANHEIINAPSASVLGQLRQENERRRQPKNLLAAFGDAVFPADFAEFKQSANEQIALAKPADEEIWRNAIRDIELKGDKFDPSSLHRLLYARTELNSLRELGGAGSFVVTGFDATREKLQSVDLSKYAILHFATHGILDPRRPENSGLFLSMVDRDGRPQNGFLGLQDIYNLRAPVDLVVLSACRTGLGKDVRGEGLIGLTRGFMYAGASSVVASLWKVDDEATSELMRQFYANMLEKQMTPSAALREAQNAIRKRPEWSSPYYWAAFTIQGEFNKPIKQPQTFRWQVYVGLLAALLLATGGCWLYFRRRRRAMSSSTLT